MKSPAIAGLFFPRRNSSPYRPIDLPASRMEPFRTDWGEGKDSDRPSLAAFFKSADSVRSELELWAHPIRLIIKKANKMYLINKHILVLNCYYIHKHHTVTG